MMCMRPRPVTLTDPELFPSIDEVELVETEECDIYMRRLIDAQSVGDEDGE